MWVDIYHKSSRFKPRIRMRRNFISVQILLDPPVNLAFIKINIEFFSYYTVKFFGRQKFIQLNKYICLRV